MTNEQIIALISVIVASITGLAAIATSVRGYFWSKDYREAKQAEMDAKEAGYLTKESEYKTQLATKEERIRLFELIADPRYVEKVERIIDEQKSNIEKLQNTNRQLKLQLKNADFQIATLEKEIAKLSISENERAKLTIFTTGSSTALDELNETADIFEEIENIQSYLNETLTKQLKWVEFHEQIRMIEEKSKEEYYQLKVTGDEGLDDESPAGVEE